MEKHLVDVAQKEVMLLVIQFILIGYISIGKGNEG